MAVAEEDRSGTRLLGVITASHLPIARAFDVEDLAGIPAADDDAETAQTKATQAAGGTGGT